LRVVKPLRHYNMESFKTDRIDRKKRNYKLS